MFRLVLLVYTAYFFSCTDIRQKPIVSKPLKDTSLQIVTTGIPDLEAITQMNFLAKRYGFRYYPIGCVVTTSKMDSIFKVNNAVYKILEARFGKGWKTNLYSQLDTANQVRQQADSIINSKTRDDEKPYFYYLVIPDLTKNKFQVKVYSTDFLNNKSELMVHYIMRITLGQEVKVDISKTFEKL
ncbi:FEKKY domain-containing protein [Limnovirga soli]|uniref:Uncharacterized protein n=1 Tax=Limnovirga soli TaxID=2656915 RepID=A0A8J8F9W3_9BACT|nr:hypothetical protein [Limnovirga soli]NNV54180.1 hypothetical protein [Limnovirga soli]